MKFFRWLFRLDPPKPQVWLICDENHTWHKVVQYGRPTAMFSWRVLGPFRSEVDAEETADRMNMVQLQRKVRLYVPKTVGEHES